MGEGPWAEPERHAAKGAEPAAVAGDTEREERERQTTRLKDQTELRGGAAKGVRIY